MNQLPYQVRYQRVVNEMNPRWRRHRVYIPQKGDFK